LGITSGYHVLIEKVEYILMSIALSALFNEDFKPCSDYSRWIGIVKF